MRKKYMKVQEEVLIDHIFLKHHSFKAKTSYILNLHPSKFSNSENTQFINSWDD